MALENIATLTCTDIESGDQAAVILRAGTNCVGLAVSLREGADAEVLLSMADAKQVLHAFEAALAHAAAKLPPGQLLRNGDRDQRSNER